VEESPQGERFSERFFSGLQALLATVEAHDVYTGEHSKAVMGLAAEVAWGMGLPGQEIVVVRHVALLHDVGKV